MYCSSDMHVWISRRVAVFIPYHTLFRCICIHGTHCMCQFSCYLSSVSIHWVFYIYVCCFISPCYQMFSLIHPIPVILVIQCSILNASRFHFTAILFFEKLFSNIVRYVCFMTKISNIFTSNYENVIFF